MAFTDLLTDLLQPWMKIRVYNIKIDSAFQLLSGTQTAGFVLTNDGTGVGTWQASSAGGGVSSMTCDDAFSPKSIVFSSSTGAINAHASGNFGPTGQLTAQTLVASSSVTTSNITQTGSGTMTNLVLAGDSSVSGSGSLTAATETLFIGQTSPAAPVAGQVLTAIDEFGSIEWKDVPTSTAVTSISCDDTFSPKSIIFSGATGAVTAHLSGNFGKSIGAGTVSSDTVSANVLQVDDTLTYANTPVVNQFLKCVDVSGLAAWADVPGGVSSVLPGPFASISVQPDTGIGDVTVEATGVFGNVSNPVDIKTYGAVQLLGSSKFKMVTGAGAGKVMVSDGSGVGSWQDEKSVGVSSMAQDGVNNNIVFTGTGGGPPYTGAVTAYCNPDFKSLPLTAGGSTLGSVTTTSVDCSSVVCTGTVAGKIAASGTPALQSTGSIDFGDQLLSVHATGGASTGYVNADWLFCPMLSGGVSTGSPVSSLGLAINCAPYGGALFPAFIAGGTLLGYTSFPSSFGNQVMPPEYLVSRFTRYTEPSGANAQWTLPNASQVASLITARCPAANPNFGLDPYRIGCYWDWTLYNDASAGGSVFLNTSLDGTCVINPPNASLNCRNGTATHFVVFTEFVGGGPPAGRLVLHTMSQTTITIS